MGALVRNCAAFRVSALILGETCISPFLRRAVRSSMGTIFQLPICEPASLERALSTLRGRNFHMVAAHPHTQEKTIWQADFTGDCCIVFGSEGYGISAAIREICHESVAVPMAGGVDSLNVAGAAAVFLSEAARQRRMT